MHGGRAFTIRTITNIKFNRKNNIQSDIRLSRREKRRNDSVASDTAETRQVVKDVLKKIKLNFEKDMEATTSVGSKVMKKFARQIPS